MKDLSKEDLSLYYESKEDYYNKTNSTNGKPQYDKDQYLKKTDIAIFSMEYLPVGHLRTDPIISQTCLSDHVHTFYGPPMVHPAVSYQELRGNDPKKTSGNVEENQSLYWHPTIYRVHEDDTKTIVEPDWVTIYYAYSAHGNTTAFPKGFRMIGQSSTDPKVQSVCYGTTSPCVKDDGTPCQPSPVPNPVLPLEACDGELGIVMLFPNCWDGVNLDSIDHSSHVAYAQGAEDATLDTFASNKYTLGENCPASHPIVLPQILLFIRLMNYKGGHHVLSNDGNWHGDYIMGWEEDFLQNVLDGCVINKDIPCDSTRRGNIYKKDPLVTVQSLQKARISTPITSCLTSEAINNTKTIPRGGCSGSLLSTDSCEIVVTPASAAEHMCWMSLGIALTLLVGLGNM